MRIRTSLGGELCIQQVVKLSRESCPVTPEPRRFRASHAGSRGKEFTSTLLDLVLLKCDFPFAIPWNFLLKIRSMCLLTFLKELTLERPWTFTVLLDYVLHCEIDKRLWERGLNIMV